MAEHQDDPAMLMVDSLETAALTKAQLAELLFEQIGLNKREAKEMVDAFFEQISQALVSGDDYDVTGDGVGDVAPLFQAVHAAGLAELCELALQAGFTVIELFVSLACPIFVIVEGIEVSIDTFLRIDTLDRGTGNAFIVLF